MSTTTLAFDYDQDQQEDFRPYRALSKLAVASIFLGILSFTALLSPALLLLPMIGIFLAAFGFLSIQRYPDELTGRAAAIGGGTLCLLLLLGSVVLHATIYVTEVPPGYQRINFFMLQPEEESPELPFAKAALELDGKQVFVKGYVYPDGQQSDIKRFILVPDMGTCCFGGQPKLTDMIEVNLKDPHRVVYSRRKRKLGGILNVDTQKKLVTGLDGVYFQLEADYVR